MQVHDKPVCATLEPALTLPPALRAGPNTALGRAIDEMGAQLARHPFLQRCRAGKARRHQLDLFLVQQYKYSVHFTRMLCALMSNLKTGEDFLQLAGNLCEELGLSDDATEPHARLYAAMLADFGLDPARHETLPETQCFIDTLYMLCRHPDPAVGLGALCLGAEAIVPRLYQDIVSGFLALDVEPARLRFFTLHIACDDAHSETMQAQMQALIEADGAALVKLTAAGETALRARLRLFDRLEAAAEVTDPTGGR